MPDNGNPSGSESELEKLFQAAECPSDTDVPKEPKISTHYECAKCGTKCQHQCPKCLGPMCEAHSSPIDPIYCSTCLPSFPVKELPLTDAEGKVVSGRRLEVDRPRYLTTAKWISELTDSELRKEIEKFKVEIHLSEQNLLNKKITQNAMQREQRERAHAENLALKQVKAAISIPRKIFQREPPTGSGAKTKVAQASSTSSANAMAAAMMKAVQFLNDQAKKRQENKNKI